MARRFDPPTAPPRVTREPIGEKYPDRAIAENADLLVTRGRDLLDPATDPHWTMAVLPKTVDPVRYLGMMAAG